MVGPISVQLVPVCSNLATHYIAPPLPSPLHPPHTHTHTQNWYECQLQIINQWLIDRPGYLHTEQSRGIQTLLNVSQVTQWEHNLYKTIPSLPLFFTIPSSPPSLPPPFSFPLRLPMSSLQTWTSRKRNCHQKRTLQLTTDCAWNTPALTWSQWTRTK